MSNSDRAVQFAPFASLRGYYDLVHDEEKLKQPRCELGEDECAAISRQLLCVQKGDRVTVTFYDRDHYKTVTGSCSRIDLTMRTLTVDGRVICIDDISALSR